MDNSVGFRVWNRLVQPSPLPETFHHPSPKKPCSWIISPDFLCAPLNPLATANLLSGTMDLPILDISYKWNHMIWSLLWPTVHFSSVQSLSRVLLFAIPWIAARQASLSITNSRSSPKLMSIESVMPSSHLILCRPLLLLPPIPPSIRVFSNESTLCIRWPKLEHQLQHQSFQWTPRTDLL